MRTLSLIAITSLLALSSLAQAQTYGLQEGTPELKSIGPLAFGPDGILFVGDPIGAQVFAIQTGDKDGDANGASYDIDGLSAKIAAALDGSGDVRIHDLAANPATGNLYVSVTRGPTPSLITISGGGIAKFALDGVAFAKAELSNPVPNAVTGEGRRRANKRGQSITDLAYMNGELVVSGLSGDQDNPSMVRSLVFPFSKVDKGAPLEIYHGAHGRWENYAAAQAFVPMIIDGEPNLLAGFVCTPLVKFPLSKISSQEPIKGTTVAELGNRNKPLDMIVYEKDDNRWILMANTARGVMKISTSNLDRAEGITDRVGGGGTAGQEYKTIEALEGTVQLDKLNDTHAVVIKGDHLMSVELP